MKILYIHFYNYRINPFNFLISMKAYEKGKSVKGKKAEWTTNGAVVDALKRAFYSSIEVI